MLRNQWWIIMNYLYMGVSMGLYSIHTIPRKWSIRLSFLLGPSSTMIPALNLPGDRIIDHCLQIKLEGWSKILVGSKTSKTYCWEVWNLTHPAPKTHHDFAMVSRQLSTATGSALKGQMLGPFFDTPLLPMSQEDLNLYPNGIPHLSELSTIVAHVFCPCFVSSFRLWIPTYCVLSHAPIWECDPNWWRYTKTETLTKHAIQQINEHTIGLYRIEPEQRIWALKSDEHSWALFSTFSLS